MNETVRRDKKTGICLIIAGILIPLALLPFVSGYSVERGFVKNLLSVGIVLSDSKASPSTEKHVLLPANITRVRIPYRFILAFGVVLIFAGYMKIEMSKAAAKPDNGG